MTRRTVLWAALALLGIAASAALAWTASQLASQRIGLSSEPLSVAAGLAPQAVSPSPAVPDQGHRHRQAHPPKTDPSRPPPRPHRPPGSPLRL